ncbi:6-carboxytetrahydropterin synthase [Marinomonas ostreistagni]|uniref:6-carboxytetrahydropterin synthase n=1 Tax=Marinomonas ostreistagni TaxID=359209 RepID=UPI00194ECDA3|nr:6-carboxytetrahydropterin synthase [Marinomonas ostreistagni]MBM6550048.1 6-carboxytetrahydropterin synthase [Marinomonas ostreistagni]
MKLFVKNLTHVDLSYFCPVRGVLGESWQVDLVLTGKLNDESMICDFSIVKKMVKQWLDAHLDHTLAVPAQHPASQLEALDNDRVGFSFTHESGQTFHCKAPSQAICQLPMAEITADQAAAWVESQILDLLPAELEAVSIRFYPEASNEAQYQYSHGLKKHDGNCQRIAHGHRSVIEILRNGSRDKALEADWAKRWQDIYLGTEDDLIGIIEEQGVRYHHFSYVSRQGLFELITPSARVYMLDCDTTVESLAAHIAKQLAKENAGDLIEVHAFEGIGKGAIFEYKVEK